MYNNWVISFIMFVLVCSLFHHFHHMTMTSRNYSIVKFCHLIMSPSARKFLMTLDALCSINNSEQLWLQTHSYWHLILAFGLPLYTYSFIYWDTYSFLLGLCVLCGIFHLYRKHREPYNIVNHNGHFHFWTVLIIVSCIFIVFILLNL